MTRSENMEHVEVLRGAAAVLRESAKQHRANGDTGHSHMCDEQADELDAAIASLSAPKPEGDVVVTRNEGGEIVAVTRQDAEGRILSVIAEAAPQPPAEAQTRGGGEVVCDCGATPENRYPHHDDCALNTAPSAPVGVEERAKAIAAEFCPRGDYDHGDVIEAIEYALAQQPAADPLEEWANRPLNFTATVGKFKDGAVGKQPAAVDGADAQAAKIEALRAELWETWSAVDPKSGWEWKKRAEQAEARAERLAEALRYARRFLRPEDHDTAYVDALLRDHDQEGKDG